jgi:selenocysteine lyase/cysteine desulfurase
VQSDEPAIVKCLALNASIEYMEAMDVETADEEIMQDKYWTLDGWEEMQEDPEFFKEYVANLDNKVMTW